MASQPSATPTCGLEDILRILPATARARLFSQLSSDRSLKPARRSCRALRDFVDEHTRRVTMPLRARSLQHAKLMAACSQGRWLERRPKCTSVHLSAEEESVSALAVPFATAPAEACRRITRLKIQCDDLPPLLGVVLLSVTARLPCLTSLDLGASAPDPDDALERQLASHALSLLPSLTNLSLGDCDFVPLIPDCVAGRLTQLKVASHIVDERPSGKALATALSKMAAAKKVVLCVSSECSFWARDVRLLLDAVPKQSPLQKLKLFPIGEASVQLSCTFAGGHLDTIEWHNEEAYDAPYSDISAVLGTAVLPSRAMGPRLRLLVLRTVEVDEEPFTPDPAAELYARCDKIRVVELKGGDHLSATLSLLRLVGTPEDLMWTVAMDNSFGNIALRDTEEEAAQSDDDVSSACGEGGGGAAGGGDGSSGGGGPGGGRGGAWSRPDKPPLAVLPLEGISSRVFECMATATEGCRDDCLLLRGPYVRGLIAADAARTALGDWLQQVSADAAEGSVRRYRVLPSAGALVVDCRTSAAAKAVAEAARRLGGAAGDGSGSGGAVVEVVHSKLSWTCAIQEVLQALWDGEGEGSAEAPAGRAEAAGSAFQSELERLRCLLETWEGLRALPAALTL
ncbi:hypothetical protein HYH03_017856 [Edaphochlamys debaryana]|uniref:Uncharacterized protein n=1 Tax=Edaphochlamys debaryana TaxID=47281 RepID=A0A835XFS8_9CHLO|nr:hypothetical protein HYH03_017856 [Edaphochlamys debaryana]|eukprot:KAG2483258.1 hypothetical protein HYH03_017856 [Edaphochlamys debaryana]